ncbi:hypothetical protein GCM10010295_38390 [Streptomyces intermedius]
MTDTSTVTSGPGTTQTWNTQSSSTSLVAAQAATGAQARAADEGRSPSAASLVAVASVVVAVMPSRPLVGVRDQP